MMQSVNLNTVYCIHNTLWIVKKKKKNSNPVHRPLFLFFRVKSNVIGKDVLSSGHCLGSHRQSLFRVSSPNVVVPQYPKSPTATISPFWRFSVLARVLLPPVGHTSRASTSSSCSGTRPWPEGDHKWNRFESRQLDLYGDKSQQRWWRRAFHVENGAGNTTDFRTTARKTLWKNTTVT